MALAVAACIQVASVQNESASAFKNVITLYLDLKNALFNDSGDSARAAAKRLFIAIDKVPMGKLPVGQHKIWMEYNEKLSYDAEHIKGTDELEHQREHFIKLSANMYKMLKELKINTGDLYYQFCPMANEGKGAYWLSEKSTISNPYMGKKMPTCGETKDTIKVVK
jgi:hypothetical protein